MNVVALVCETSSSLRVFYIAKVIMSLIIVGVPVILAIVCMIDLTKAIISKEVGKEVYSNISKKIVVGMLVLLVIPIHNMVLEMIGSNKIEETGCWINATKDYISQLELKEKEQREAAAAAKKAENERKHQEILAKIEEAKKRIIENENKIEEENEELPSNYDGSSENGTWGLLTVKNGVFILPNRRATSNKETPSQSGYKGLNPIFWSRLEQLINDANKQPNCKVTISSGHRSYSTQLSTWNDSYRSCPERCSWVAYPGGSRHNFGIAADLKYNGNSCKQSNYSCNSCARWVHNNASKYGLKFRLSNEPWHIEPIQVQGGSYTSCRSICKSKL